MRIFNQITLICIDTVQPQEAILAMMKSMESFKFAKCKLFTDCNGVSKKYKKYNNDIELIDIGTINNITRYSEFCLKELDDYIETDYCLTVQHDGFIVRPNLWTDEFLEYDYIGAPWPEKWGYVNRVGNGGFNLKSKKFLQVCKKIFKNIDMQVDIKREKGYLLSNDDFLYSVVFYKEMLKEGIKYAPVELAARFSIEHPVKEMQSESFGFHETFTNFTKEAYLEKYINITT
jgi:hypothetical protein